MEFITTEKYFIVQAFGLVLRKNNQVNFQIKFFIIRLNLVTTS